MEVIYTKTKLHKASELILESLWIATNNYANGGIYANI